MKILFGILGLIGFYLATPAPVSGEDLVPRSEISPLTLSGITRCLQCSAEDARTLGMIPTGTHAVFPAGLECPQVDSETWALDYSFKRAREAMHGGVDIPSPFGTPILAVADGEVVGTFATEDYAEGIKILLRHSPADTGKSYWSYTEYAHLAELPANLKIGDRVKRGDTVGLTSNTGISGAEARRRYGGGDTKSKVNKTRRPALHFSVMISDSPKYWRSERHIVPKDGRWLDPIAFYLARNIVDAKELAGLPEKEKAVNVPVLAEGNTSIPPLTRISWPYRCRNSN